MQPLTPTPNPQKSLRAGRKISCFHTLHFEVEIACGFHTGDAWPLVWRRHQNLPLNPMVSFLTSAQKIRQDGVAVIFGLSRWRQNVLGLCVLKLNLSGASIALNFDGPKRMESYKNEKSNILIPNYKQINPTLFHISVLNSFKKSQIYKPHFSFEKHLNKYWNS